jgi:hypothetical protein
MLLIRRKEKPQGDKKSALNFNRIDFYLCDELGTNTDLAHRQHFPRNRQRNVRQRNNSRHGLFPIPLPNIPLPVIPLSSRPSPVSSLFICGSNSFFEVQLLRHSASNRDGAEGSGPQRARRPILPHGASSRRDGRCGAGKGRVSERVSGGQAKIYSRPFPLDAHQCQRFASARTFRKSLARTI